MTLEKLRFYLHDVQLRERASGKWKAAKRPDGEAPVWLLDLDDASCDPEFSPEMQKALLMTVPPGEFDALRFELGVPESLNHLDPLKAPEHLNQTSMHWGWQAGYRFLRLDGKLEGGASFPVHLGSTVCKGEIGAEIVCERGNRPGWTIEQPWFVKGRTSGAITLDLGVLLEGMDWSKAEGCMGHAGQGDCTQILENIGLDPTTGEPREAGSHVFRGVR